MSTSSSSSSSSTSQAALPPLRGSYVTPMPFFEAAARLIWSCLLFCARLPDTPTSFRVHSPCLLRFNATKSIPVNMQAVRSHPRGFSRHVGARRQGLRQASEQQCVIRISIIRNAKQNISQLLLHTPFLHNASHVCVAGKTSEKMFASTSPGIRDYRAHDGA